MDEFERVGFDEELCEQLREIVRRTGIDSDSLLSFATQNKEASMIFVEPTYGVEKLEEKIVNIKIIEEHK